LEGVVSITAAAGLLVLATQIKVNPMVREGQVSGLAALQLRFAWLALPLIAVVIANARSAHFELISRFVCAAFAGLASGFVAGGVAIALRGTPYCLNGHWGDSGTLALWANAISAHDPSGYPPHFYPPLFPWALAWYKDLVGQPALYALKDLQLAGAAVLGPVSYLAWRMLLRPGWALAIGILAAFVVIEPYKPYENLVLVVLLPTVIRYLQVLRRADERTIKQLLEAGLVFGVAFGVMCLTYSGWLRWSAPGVIASALIVVPWRGGRWKASVVLGVLTIAVFTVVIWGYLWNIETYVKEIAPSGQPIVRDNYVYFDVLIDPAYFAMWKGDLPGATTVWPPPGEIGGLGVYSLLGFSGIGIALAMGRARTAVIALLSIFTGTWLMRFWYAHLMFKTHFVQLYPRTSIELAYIIVVVGGFAAYYVVEYVARRREDSPLRDRWASIGSLVALAFVIGSAASSVADRYMPTQALSPGRLANLAHDASMQKIPPDPP